MRRAAVIALLSWGPILPGCSSPSPPQQGRPLPLGPPQGEMSVPGSEVPFDRTTICEAREQEGRYCLTAKQLTLVFEGIPIGSDGKGRRHQIAFQEPSVSYTVTQDFGTTTVRMTQTRTDTDTADVAINDYKLRLVDGGKALEIDGKSYPFDKPQTVIISREGRVVDPIKKEPGGNQ